MDRTRVAIVTFGCRANQYESDLMRALLEPTCALVDRDADVWILNACTVTGLAERKARQVARRIRRQRPGARIIVIGCLADAVAQGTTQFSDADLLAGNAWKARVARVVEEALAGTRGLLPPEEPLPLDTERSPGPPNRIRAFLRIQDGCARACTYCRATQVRGESRCKSIPNLLDEARGLVRAGFPEIVLTGIDLAQYKPPQGTLADLVRELLSIDALVRLRIASINPSGITEDLLSTLAGDERACPHLHVPLQSGDDAVLRRMARGYTVKDVLDRIALARRELPDPTFGTDIIVGFPGEDDAAFENTCQVIDSVGFSNLHAFRFSPRTGTEAATFDGKVSGAVKRERADAIAARWRSALAPILDKRIGTTQHVLVEERRAGVWRGYTRDYIHVRFTSSEEIRIGSIRPVRVTGAKTEYIEGYDERRANTD